ncbi:MAG: KEOPS complex subunit Pcc1 [Candidatus Hadarchaeota archaeon]
MKIKAEIFCDYGDEKVSNAVARAIGPDNLPAPRGMKILTKVVGRRVVTWVELDGKIETLISTLDDLLACTSAAENML